MQHPDTCGHFVFWMMQPELCWQALWIFIPLTVDDLCTFCISPIKSNEARYFSCLNQRINRNNNLGSHIALMQWMVTLGPSDLRCKCESFPPLVKPHMQHSFFIFFHFFFTLMVKVSLSVCVSIGLGYDSYEIIMKQSARVGLGAKLSFSLWNVRYLRPSIPPLFTTFAFTPLVYSSLTG